MQRKLFTPVPELNLKHRIVMSPLTRIRGVVPTEDHVAYYTQRASPGGLIITEGSPIAPTTQYETAAGIYTKEQEEAWTRVTTSVHQKGTTRLIIFCLLSPRLFYLCTAIERLGSPIGGKISIQLWHLGRMNHSSWVGGV
jgi:2,4-dienoyl-CoA reductase-like NADH-dependent reductase (Old Yellow Enzyme family)